MNLPKSFYDYELESSMCSCVAGLHERITLTEWVNPEWVRYVSIDCFDKDKFDVNLILPQGYVKENKDKVKEDMVTYSWEVRDCCEEKDCDALVATASVETLEQVETEVKYMFEYQRNVGLAYLEMSKK
jgi:hypothetical protein